MAEPKLNCFFKAKVNQGRTYKTTHGIMNKYNGLFLNKRKAFLDRKKPCFAPNDRQNRMLRLQFHHKLFCRYHKNQQEAPE